MSEGERPRGLDPDRAADAVRSSAAGALTGETPPVALLRTLEPIDTRRYQRMIGGLGLALVLAFSVYLYVTGGSSTPGIPAGQRIHRFVAPLATSDLNVPANAHPRCDPARPARRGLNVCGRVPTVLVFFALGAAPCVREVDAAQALARRFPGVQFGAVAINAGRAATAAVVRRHRWTIPVAFDLTGAIGQIYGVAVCPIIELIRRGGLVEQRLIGEAWQSPRALAGPVSRLAGVSGG